MMQVSWVNAFSKLPKLYALTICSIFVHWLYLNKAGGKQKQYLKLTWNHYCLLGEKKKKRRKKWRKKSRIRKYYLESNKLGIHKAKQITVSENLANWSLY